MRHCAPLSAQAPTAGNSESSACVQHQLPAVHRRVISILQEALQVINYFDLRAYSQATYIAAARCIKRDLVLPLCETCSRFRRVCFSDRFTEVLQVPRAADAGWRASTFRN